MSILDLPGQFTPTHNTDGLSGYPAVDVFGKPGSPVGAPAAGTLQDVHFIPWNIAKRIGGWTAYLVSDTGTYFLTHLGSALPSGTKVSGGMPIGTLGAVPQNAWAAHVHEGFNAGGKGPGNPGGSTAAPASTSGAAAGAGCLPAALTMFSVGVAFLVGLCYHFL